MTWNVDAAVASLQANALVHSVGHCAKYVRQAVAAGGIALQRTLSAKDYGPSLTSAGFTEFVTAPEGGYRKGDIAVIESTTGHPHGHIQMYDGGLWISDFKQLVDFWPGANYRKYLPSFKIYRYPTP
jgi:hypothetical protein